MFSYQTRRDGIRVIGIGVASFLTIFPLCVWRHLEIIESDLLERSEAALIEAGLESLDISVDGRDIRLAGPATEPGIEEAAALLAELRGVRKVRLVEHEQSGAD